MKYPTEKLLAVFSTVAHGLKGGRSAKAATDACGDDTGIAYPIAKIVSDGHYDLLADVLTGERDPHNAGVASRQRRGFNEHLPARE
jgi:hypothetical protein